MRKPSLVIFDCDGVLVDSELIACRVDAECLAAAGFPETADSIRETYVGVSSRTMFDDLEKRYRKRLPDGFADRLRQQLDTAFERELKPIAGIVDLLESLGIAACVASSSDPARLRHSLGLTGLWPHFAPHVFSATMVRNGKPAPDLLLYAAERMGAAPRDCPVVEDSRAGVAAGIAAGMRVFGFSGGSHCRPDHGERLREAGAHAVFGDMRALPALLEAA